MKIAVMGVVHPVSLPFIDKYLESIAKQSYKDFRYFLFSHRVASNLIDDIVARYDNNIDIEHYKLDNNASPPRSRELAIKYVKKQQFDICLFTDTDDFYHQDYVKSLVDTLIEKKCKITFCDLFIYFSDTNIIGDYFQQCNVPDIVDINYIRDKNCIGFGHSGMYLDIFDHRIPHFPDNLIALDWWFYSVLMIVNKCSARFTKKSLCYYRQHDENIVGFLGLDEKRILRGLDVKALQYENLSKLESDFISYHNVFSSISAKLVNNRQLKKKYVETILSKYRSKKYLWWEYVLPLEDL